MNRRGLPLQEEQSPDLSLQEEQSSQQQQRSENRFQPWQDEAGSLSLQEFSQQQQRSENLFQPWQDEAGSLSLQEFSQQQRSENRFQPWQDEAGSLSLQEFSQQQQRSENLRPQLWQDEAQSLQFLEQQQTLQNPYLQEYELNPLFFQFQGDRMQSVYYDQGQYFSQNIQHYENYTIPEYVQGAHLYQQASGQHMFTGQGYNIEPQNLFQQVTYNQQSQEQMLQALSKKDEASQDFSQDFQYTQRMQNLQLHQTSDLDQQLEENNQQILNIPQHISHDLSQKQKAGNQPQQQSHHIPQNLQHAQGIYSQQHRAYSDQQSIQASNQLSHMEQQRRQDISQQSATQSHLHQISQLPQQPQSRSQGKKHQSQHQGKKDQQQRSWDQSGQASHQWPYTKERHSWDKSQQSPTQNYSQHHQLNPLQPHEGKKDQQQRIWDQQQHIKDDNIQQQQQITPDTLATLSKLTLKGTRELDMASSTIKECQARIPKRQRKQPSKTAFLTVNTNMFKINFKNNFLKKAVHYDVDITIIEQPKVQTTSNRSNRSNRFSKTLYRKIFETCRRKHFEKRYPAFDGKKNAYSAYDLPFKSNPNILETIVEMSSPCNEQCRAECNKHVKKFKVILKKVAEIDLSWIRNLPFSLGEVDGYQTGIQALDIIMRHKPESKHINVGGSFFWQDGLDESNEFKLSNELRAARGGFLSVILGQQMYLNVDVVHKAFFKPEEVSTLYKRYHNDTHTINRLLNNLKVTCRIPRHNERSYRLEGLGRKPNEHNFVYKDENISVTNYFVRRYNYRLKQPTWRCLVVKGQQTYLPPELCIIESGQSVKKLNDVETSNMIRIAAVDALVRKEEINKVFEKLVDNNSEIMKHEFQLSVENKMETVNAKILNAPNIIYANSEVNVSKGTWHMQKFKQPINLEKNQWTILCIRDTNDTIRFDRMKKFMGLLIYHALSVGMHIGETNTNTFKSIEKKSKNIKEYFQKNKEFKLIIVVIPNSPGTIYNEIKQIAELELGILTQCIKFSNFNSVFQNAKKEKSIITNILLKINTKLNGINHALNPKPKCFEKICMFVGADVTHPSYDEDKPSIAAVTASNDIDGLQYNVIHKVLPSKQEIIMDLKNIIDVQLSIYKDKTSRLPERIIYYRDGVSEGQLPQVMHYEIEAIRDAYKNKCKCDIEITCLIVQKRHHVRLFPTCDSRGWIISDKNYNVKAGTIVDSGITHPSHFDFYLVSHANIQGTARPTRYKCICNDSNFTENEIEELTYYLCHMYARCTRTVSYPVPTYYAHLAAYRGKVLLHGYSDNDDRLRDIQQRFNTKMVNLPMYFV